MGVVVKSVVKSSKSKNEFSVSASVVDERIVDDSKTAEVVVDVGEFVVVLKTVLGGALVVVVVFFSFGCEILWIASVLINFVVDSGAFVVVTVGDDESFKVVSNPNESPISSIEKRGNGSSVVLSIVFVLANASKLKSNGFCGFLLFSLSISLKKLFAKLSDSISNESSSEAVVASFRIVVVDATVDDLTKVKMLLMDDGGCTGAISLLTFKKYFQ